MNNFFPMLLSADSTQSSGRYGFLFTVILSNVVVWGVWLFICIYKRDIVNIPEGVGLAYAAAQGLSFAGKGLQSFAERKPMAKSNFEVD